MAGSPERSVGVKLGIAGRLLRTRFDHRAHSIGLTRAQWRTILAIRHAEGATQRRIAEMLEVGDVTTGRLIDRLHESGLIERRADPNDRRANRLYLTKAAEPLLEQLEALGQEEERCALAGLSQEQVAALALCLDKVIENLQRSCERSAEEQGASGALATG